MVFFRGSLGHGIVSHAQITLKHKRQDAASMYVKRDGGFVMMLSHKCSFLFRQYSYKRGLKAENLGSTK